MPGATAGPTHSLVLSRCWDTEPAQDISPTLWGQILSGPIDRGCTSSAKPWLQSNAMVAELAKPLQLLPLLCWG